jgi:SAGA-associated factor 29
MSDVWHNLVDTLRLLPPMAPGTRIALDEDKPPRPLSTVRSEKSTLDEALQKLDVLIAMRRNEEAGHDAASIPLVSVQASTPSSGGGIKRKRRTSLSYSASPAPVGMPSSADSILSAAPSPMVRGATPGNRESQGGGNTKQQRKEQYADQLPLQPGRKVAFKMPPQPGEEEESWILATVIRCLGGDKTRYEVQDADDGA